MPRLRDVVGVLAISLCLVIRVLAAKNTSPTEAVFLWYAYRMDFEAFGKREDGIAFSCPGTFTDGTCKFDEFIRYIHKGQNAMDPNLKTSIGDELWPDADTAANEVGKLKQIGGDPYTAHDPEKLFKNGASVSGLSNLLKQVTNMLQAARTKLGDNSDKIKPGLEQARKAMENAQRIRLEETARNDELVTALGDFKKETGRSFTVESNPFTSPEGWTGKLIDMDEMAKQSTWDTDWKEYQLWIDTKKNKKKFGYLVTARLHTNALVGVQDQATRLHGPPSC